MFPDSNYLGVISYANEQIKNPQPIWIWKKHKFCVESVRLYLRKFKMTDVKQMADIMKNENNMKYIANGSTKTLNETKNMIEKYIKDAYTFYPILLSKNNKIIGYIGYFDGVYLEEEYMGMNFMRILIDEKCRGYKYAYEIYNAFLKSVSQTMYAMILPENVASIKLHEKLKFKFYKNINYHSRDYALLRYGVN